MKGTGSLVVRVKRVGWNAKFVSCLVDGGGGSWPVRRDIGEYVGQCQCVW